MRTKRVLIYDAFTDTPFEGNPCAILPDAEGLDDAAMAKIAREMNLSETCFVTKSDAADYKVRFFMPRCEINFAGHPTIATAAMLANEGMVHFNGDCANIQLEFNIGVLPVEMLSENGRLKSVIMTQSDPFLGEKVERATLAACFKDMKASDLNQEVEPQISGAGTNFLIMLLNDLEKLEYLEMNRPALAELLTSLGVNAVYAITQRGLAAKTAMHGRLCDPLNAFEDPFTGSTAGAAGVYLTLHGLNLQDKMIIEQGHFIGRPGIGELLFSRKADGSLLVKLGGNAVKVMDGVIHLE